MTQLSGSSRLERIAKEITPVIEDITNNPLRLDNISFEFANLSTEYKTMSLEWIFRTTTVADFDGRSNPQKVRIAKRYSDAPYNILINFLAHELTHASDYQNNDYFNIENRKINKICKLECDLLLGIDQKRPHLIRQANKELPTYKRDLSVLNIILESHARFVEDEVCERLKVPEIILPKRELFYRAIYAALKLTPEYKARSAQYTKGIELVKATYARDGNINTLFKELPKPEHFSNPEQYFIDREERPKLLERMMRESHFCWDY